MGNNKIETLRGDFDKPIKLKIGDLREFLEWQITPQNEEEQLKFKNIVDDYIELKLRIPFLTEDELIEEINNQLEPYDLQFDGFL